MQMHSRSIGKMEEMLERMHAALEDGKAMRIVCLDAQHAANLRARWLKQYPKDKIPVFTILRSEQE
jgi:hypothetical protein